MVAWSAPSPAESVARMRADLIAAGNSPAALSALYREWVGYCPFDDEPGADPLEVRLTLVDYLREVCAILSVPFQPVEL